MALKESTRSTRSRLNWQAKTTSFSTTPTLLTMINSVTCSSNKSWWLIFRSTPISLSRWPTHALRIHTASLLSLSWTTKARRSWTLFRILNTSLSSYYLAASKQARRRPCVHQSLTATTPSSLRPSWWRLAWRTWTTLSKSKILHYFSSCRDPSPTPCNHIIM